MEIVVRIPFDHENRNAEVGEKLTVSDFDGTWLIAHGVAEEAAAPAAPGAKPKPAPEDTGGGSAGN